MNDETKAALDYLHEQTDMRVIAWKRDLYGLVLAHIDAEPARLAAAREEQRSVDLARSRKAKYALTGGPNSLAGAWNAGIESAIEGVLSTPLTSTPLADRIAELEAERDALRAQVKAARTASTRGLATVLDVIAAMDEAKP